MGNADAEADSLLGNALFRGQRGWVSLENDRFKTKLGTSILS